MIIKKPFLHPFLFAAYQIVFLYVHNMDEVPIGNTFRSFSVTLLAVLILTLFLKGVIRRKYRPEIITTLFIFLFFSYDYLVLFVNRLKPSLENPLIWHLSALIIFVVLTCALVKGVLQIPDKHLEKITRFFTASAFCLLFFQILIAVQFSLSLRGFSSIQARSEVGGERERAYRPDVYYIVLDAYARQDVLKEIFGYDNSPFIDFLENSGFYIAHKSRANYDYTYHSMASQLNMAYLEDVPGLPGPQSKSELPLGYATINSEVRRQFEKRGYKYIFNKQKLSSNLNVLNIKPSSGYFNLFTSRDNPFERFVIYKTPLHLFHILTRRYYYSDRRKEIRYRLKYISKVINDPAPTFLHTHVYCPHPPFIFDKDGKSVSQSETNISKMSTLRGIMEFRRYYRPQLEYINSEVKKIIENIMANSPEKPIIILMSDHGPNSLKSYVRRTGLQIPKYYKERFSNLLAFYFPDQHYEALYPEISLVNSFRVILNHVFDQEYTLLEDKSYHLNPKKPYVFKEVTDRIEV